MVHSVAVVGATGRMGTLATRLIEASDDFVVHARIGSRDPLTALKGADVALDLTLPAVSPDVVAAAIESGIPTVVGTSGWSAERLTRLRTQLGDEPQLGVIVVPNFSLGSVIATRLAAIAAPWFDSIEVIEAHHAAKSDSPSGTAVRTAELMAEARTQRPVAAPHADQRARGQQVGSIPVHSLRVHGVLAEQQVIFGGLGETLRVSHQTVSDASYESGIMLALRAVSSTRGLVVGLDTLLGIDGGA